MADRPAVRLRSMVVLPLENLSGDSAQDYFADGMTEELIAALARLEGVHVTSGSSLRRTPPRRWHARCPEAYAAGSAIGVPGLETIRT